MNVWIITASNNWPYEAVRTSLEAAESLAAHLKLLGFYNVTVTEYTPVKENA